MERAPSCIGTTATQRPIASGNKRAEHEPHALCIKDLGDGAVIDVADTAPLDPKNHVDGDRAQKAQQASTQEQPADFLVVGRCQPIGDGGKQAIKRAVSRFDTRSNDFGGGINGCHTKWSSLISFNGSDFDCQVVGHNGPRLLARGHFF